MRTMRELIGQSPLTDPRSLASSLVVHALLLLLASAAVLTATTSESRVLPRALRGELDAVDNRTPPSKAGGGAPGAAGGIGLVEYVPRAIPGSSSARAAYSSADAVISEILPTQGASESIDRSLPGPQTAGIGVLPGPGTGGGGGSGGGSGGGVGRGVGPGTEFFGARERAGSYTYVIDCSGSMATRRSLDIAKRELLASLNQLPPDAQFGIVFYNLQATVFADPQKTKGMDFLRVVLAPSNNETPQDRTKTITLDQLGTDVLMPATSANKERVRTQLGRVVPDGGTDHMIAIRTAFALKPEVIYFLTDADLMTASDVDNLLAEHGKTRIQAIEFGRGADLEGDQAPLSKLARATGGQYRYVDVTTFPER